jgi:hypothetical protein
VVLVKQFFIEFIKLVLMVIVVDGATLVPKFQEGIWSHRATKRAASGWYDGSNYCCYKHVENHKWLQIYMVENK